MITRKEFEFEAANGGHNIFACIWTKEGSYNHKGIVQIAHGMSEHCLRYEGFASYLCNKGYVVCSNDHCGHGRSVENDDELGFFGEQENSYKFLIEDMNTLMIKVKTEYQKLPFIFIGHSMGSLLVRQFAKEFPSSIDCAILLGTSGPRALIDMGILFANKGIGKKGAMVREGKIDKLIIKLFNSGIHHTWSLFDWISSSNKEVEKFEEDDRCGFLFTYAGYRELFLLLKEVSTQKWALAMPKKLPTLLISGSKDLVGAKGKGAKQVFKMLMDAGCEKVHLRIYKEMYHEVLNEKNREMVYEYIHEWISKNAIDYK